MMLHTRKSVVLAAAELFRHQDLADVMAILDLYGVKSYERERERVQLAILKLSEGDAGKLLHYLDVAKKDYRDVLYWAEYPPDA